jgi:RNAse (barnase) inhibitor barstar
MDMKLKSMFKMIMKNIFQPATIDWQNVEDKATSLMDQIDRLSKMFEEKKYKEVYDYSDRLKEKIRKFRRAGLERMGQYSPENIAFKVLRRNEYINKLVSLRIAAYDAMNSIEAPSIKISIDETVGSWKQFLGSKK